MSNNIKGGMKCTGAINQLALRALRTSDASLCIRFRAKWQTDWASNTVPCSRCMREYAELRCGTAYCSEFASDGARRCAARCMQVETNVTLSHAARKSTAEYLCHIY